jgi:single-strand DNA-binding protein
MINQVILVGRMTRDIEVRYTKENKPVGNFTLAVQRRFKDSKGEYPVDFIDCVVFGNQAETLHKYSKKGDSIGVEGSMQKRDYESKDGKKIYITEVMVDKIYLLPKNKTTQETTQEENPYKDMSIKVESESNIKYDEQQLPF